MKTKLPALPVIVSIVVLIAACFMPRVHGEEVAGSEPAAVRLVTSAATEDATGPAATPGDPDAVATADALAELTAALKSALVPLVEKAPWTSVLVAIVGGSRFFMKPTYALMLLLRKRAQNDGKKDELDAVVQSKWFKVLLFVLDLLLSVKVAGQK